MNTHCDYGVSVTARVGIAMFASEYWTATFEDVCHVLEGFAERGMADSGASRPAGASEPTPHKGFPLVSITGRLHPVSNTVASVAVQWANPSSPTEWEQAELRIIRVESGTPPLTELLLSVRSSSPAADARNVLEALVRRAGVGVSMIAGQAPLVSGATQGPKTA